MFIFYKILQKLKKKGKQEKSITHYTKKAKSAADNLPLYPHKFKPIVRYMYLKYYSFFLSQKNINSMFNKKLSIEKF